MEENIKKDMPEAEENITHEDIEGLNAPEQNPSEEDFAKSLQNPDILQYNAEDSPQEAPTPQGLTQEEVDRQLAEMKDQLVRTLAEMENLRKRTRKDVDDARKFAVTSIAKDLITVLENLRRAEQSIPADQIDDNDLLKNILMGVQMTSNELLNVFKSHGIERIDPKGEMFNPSFHQAMTEIPSPDYPAGTVLDVMQAGYVIKDRLLRPAMVVLAKAPEPASATETPPTTAAEPTPTPATPPESQGDAT